MRFSVYPKPKEEQSPACYFRTLASCNGFSSVSIFTRFLFDSDSLQPMTVSAEELATKIGRTTAHVDSLDLLTMCHGSRRHTYGGLTVPRHQLVKTERYCPDCIREEAFCRSEWQIGWLPMCTKHCRPLLGMTPEVESALFNGTTIPHQSSEPVSGLIMDYVLLSETQRDLESRLKADSRKIGTNRRSIVDEIDEYLTRSMGLNEREELTRRKRRYPVQFYPLDLMGSLRFLECLSHEIAA